jgi:hypothetical protein
LPAGKLALFTTLGNSYHFPEIDARIKICNPVKDVIFLIIIILLSIGPKENQREHTNIQAQVFAFTTRYKLWPLSIIMLRKRNCGISACTVVEKNVRIPERFFSTTI